MDRPIARRRGLVAAFFFTVCLCCIAAATVAQTIRVRPVSPPDDALQLILGPDNTVTMTLAPDDNATKGPVNLTLHLFWTADDSPVDVVFKNSSDAQDNKKIQVKFGEPFVLQVSTGGQSQTVAAETPTVWGYIEASYGGDKNNETTVSLPVAIGAFAPAVKDNGTLSIPAAGRTKLQLDMSQYLVFGNVAQFQLTSFSSGSQQLQPKFTNDDTNASDTLIAQYSADDPTVWLEIDASEFQPGTEYKGALRTVIDGKQFIDRPLILKRAPWAAETAFAPIQPIITKDNKAVLTVRAAADQNIRGIFVTTTTAANDDFDPRMDLDVTLDGASLWTLASGDSQEIRNRSLAPGEIKEIVVTPHRHHLRAGKHEVSLVVGALNVGVDKGTEAKITFVVRHHWLWAVAVLVMSVLMSYVITKGIVTLMNRRNVIKRIADIKNESWLKNDRWGALPIVRAFVRLELADKAINDKPHLNRKHFLTFIGGLVPFTLRFFSRLVTAPQLISDEIEEVSKRLETFKKLNKLAIYWRAAPSDTGAIVDADYRIIWRAHKVLRDIVDRLSLLYRGEDIPADVVAKLEKLETWSQEDSLQTEYLAAQHKDIERLLVRVDPQRFGYDTSALNELIGHLKAIEQSNYDQTVTDAAKASLAACQAFADDGIKTLNQVLLPIAALVEDKSVTDTQLLDHAMAIKQCRQILATSVRETVRDLVEKLSSKYAPDSMKEIMAMEDNYIRMKLLWDQRYNAERCQTLVEKIHADTPLEVILKEFDTEIWSLLKQPGTLRIVDPTIMEPVEQYSLTDFKVECTNPKANTFLFKHGVQYEWRIDYGGRKPLTPITRCPMVTQFIPQIYGTHKVKVSVDVRWGNEKFPVKNGDSDHISFMTLTTNRYKNLWPTSTPELLGVAIALGLALIAGFQSDAFVNALEGSWKEYLTLFAWGVGAEQTKTLIQNLEKPFKTDQA